MKDPRLFRATPRVEEAGLRTQLLFDYLPKSSLVSKVPKTFFTNPPLHVGVADWILTLLTSLFSEEGEIEFLYSPCLSSSSEHREALWAPPLLVTLWILSSPHFKCQPRSSAWIQNTCLYLSKCIIPLNVFTFVERSKHCAFSCVLLAYFEYKVLKQGIFN